MDIQEMINDIQEKIDVEQTRINEQEVLVNDLSRRYTEQMAILRAMRTSIQSLNKCVIELRRTQEERKIGEADYEEGGGYIDERYKELTALLDEAADIAIKRGLLIDSVTTKTGTTLSMRKSAVNRARHAIVRYCRGYSYIDYVATMTEDDLIALRNVGSKTRVIIQIAQDIIKGRPTEGEIES